MQSSSSSYRAVYCHRHFSERANVLAKTLISAHFCFHVSFIHSFCHSGTVFILRHNEGTNKIATHDLTRGFCISRLWLAYIDSRPVLQPSCGHAQLFNNSFCHDIHSLTLGRRVTVVVWSFVHSFILSPGTVFTSTPQRRHEQDRHVNISRFDSWILLKRWRSRVMASLH